MPELSVKKVSSVALIYLTLMLAGLEIATRVWLDGPIMDSKTQYYQPHPFLNYELNPNHSDHNELGFRGQFNKKDSIDIVCMGGSTTYCVKVSEENSWPALLADMSGLNTLNCGVPAYTTAHHIPLLALRLVHLKPKVIIFHIGFNDLKTEYLYPNLKTDYSNAFKAWDEPLYYRSQFLAKIIDGSQHINRIVEHIPHRQFTTENQDTAFRSNVEVLSAVCKLRGIKVLFVIQPTNFKHLHFKDLPAWERGMRDKASFLLQLSGKWGFNIVDLREKMSNREVFFADYIHVNERGARVKAELIAEKFPQLGVFN